MASKVNICSMACTLIGANRVTDLDNPTTEEERLCVLWWDQVLEETLHEHDWKFAREYKAALAVSVSPSGEYDHAYQLPSDCLVLRYLWDTDAADRVVADEYEIQGTQILTDLDTVNVVYTKRDANVGRYPTFFVRALTYLLAHYLAAIGNSDAAVLNSFGFRRLFLDGAVFCIFILSFERLFL